ALPTRTSSVIASTFSLAASAPAASWCEMYTVPSSSMSILAPVASWIPLIVLPPGPINRPIFSGLMLNVNSRGANGLISGRGWRRLDSMDLRISRRGLRGGPGGPARGGLDDRLVDAVDLQVQLDAVDPQPAAGDLEVHVADVVLVAHDVGQQGEAVRLLDQPDRDPRHRVGDRHARVHQRQ